MKTLALLALAASAALLAAPPAAADPTCGGNETERTCVDAWSRSTGECETGGDQSTGASVRRTTQDGAAGASAGAFCYHYTSGGEPGRAHGIAVSVHGIALQQVVAAWYMSEGPDGSGCNMYVGVDRTLYTVGCPVGPPPHLPGPLP